MICTKQDGPSLSTQIWSARTCEVGLVDGRQRWAAAAARCYVATWSTFTILNHDNFANTLVIYMSVKK